MLKWDISKHQLFLIRDMRTPDETKKIAADSVIVFDQRGTGATEKECLRTLQTFLENQSGPCGEFQWQVNMGWKVHDNIWQAAKRVWGLPRLTTTHAVQYLTYSENWQEEESTPRALAADHFGLLESQEVIRQTREMKALHKSGATTMMQTKFS